MTQWTLPQTASARFAVALFDLLEFGIDDVGLALSAGRAGAAGIRCGGVLHGFAEPQRGLRQPLSRLLDPLYVVPLYRLFELRHGLLHLALHVRWRATLRFLETLFDCVNGGIRLIACFHQLASPLFFLGVGFSLLDHALDIGLVKPARRLDANGLLLAARLVFGRHVDDAIRVDVERHFDLRHPAWRRGNADEIKLAQ